jgi:arylsulfatase A-like enzyme
MTMIKIKLFALCVLFPPLASAGGDWVNLFDGKTTEGWTPRSAVVSFEAKNNELQLLSKTNCWVTTGVEMADFEVELEVLLPAEAGFNSGLAFRCIGAKGKPKGYQCEIDRGKPAGVYGIGTGGWLYPAGKDGAEYAAKVKGLLKPKAWNHFKVRAVGPRIRTWLNGKPVADIKHQKIIKGYFGIQHHGKGGLVRFRNIRAREVKGEEQVIEAKPNILWITAEDMSPTLGCYGDPYAITPNIDLLAKRATRYDNAFAASPVCSPSRSVLITGMYNVSTGTNQMRSGFPLPEGVKGFPSYLRRAGYFTTNNVKTDYNTSDSGRVIEESWNESSAKAHWRSKERKKGQPFFAVFNLMTSHQSRSMVWPYDVFKKHVQSRLSSGQVHDPKNAPVPPYYPDTPLVRKTMARYYDCVSAMDIQVGEILRQLEEDGHAEDTIVFFYSDHGSGMPRHKRLLHDSGMRVAMLVHIPEKWRHLRPTKPGASTESLVSFIDFAPTTLKMAQLAVPEYMQGIPFLAVNEGTPAREIVYGTRDRVDEVFECSRSVRDRRWLYIRNYHPHLSWNQPSVFSDLGEIRNEITGFAAKNGGSLSIAQKHYAGPMKAVEELYDCRADPQNTRNLLLGKMTPEVKENLLRLRKSYIATRQEIGDCGALPESEMRRMVTGEGKPMRDIILGATNHKPDLKAAWRSADKVGMADSTELIKGLRSGDVSGRYWAIIGLRHQSFGDTGLHAKVVDFLDDVAPAVRIETAAWLAHFPKYRKLALQGLVKDLGNGDWAVALRACRAIELLGERAKSVLPVMRSLYERTRHAAGDNNFFVAFSSGAFLEKLGQKTDPWDFTPGAGSFMPAVKKKKKE